MITNPPFPKNYSRELLVMDRGEGVYLYDRTGNKYLDFGSGIAVNALGYGRSDLAETAAGQMRKLIHISNLYATEPALHLAELLITLGDFSAVHFGNSGSEANESAIKYARLYSLRTKGDGHHKILAFENGFHGRTLGALSCTASEKYQGPFRPLIPGITFSPYNDEEKLEELLDDSYSCILAEVIQGEGGLQSMNRAFAERLNSLCKKHDVLLIADEVQTGLGRTGFALASEIVGLKPDIVTLSKPLAGGLPLSATLIPEKINSLLHIGEHGTTFGGGPVTTAVAGVVLDKVLQKEFLSGVRKKGEYLKSRLREIAKSVSFPAEVRGEGLLQGISLHLPEDHTQEIMTDILTKCREKGLILLRSGVSVLRIAPPLIISENEIKEGTDIISSVLSNL